MRKKPLGLVASAALLSLVALRGPAVAKPVELNYSIFMPPTHVQAQVGAEWSKEVEKRTNGAVKIKVFPAGGLMPAEQVYDGIIKGIADIGVTVLSYNKGRFPLTEVIDLPLGYTSGLQATRLANAYYQKFQPRELSDVKVMYLIAHGPGILHTKKPVEKLEDLKGVKIRCTGSNAKLVAALGATPVAMPITDTYDALQKGVVDGVVSPIEALKGWKFAEVTKHTTLNYGSSYSLAFAVFMNKEKWNSLPKDVQATIEAVNREWIDKAGKGWDDFDRHGVEFGTAKGVKMAKLSPTEEQRWSGIVKPVLGEYVAAAKAKGLPGDEALQFCQEWLAKNAR